MSGRRQRPGRAAAMRRQVLAEWRGYSEPPPPDRHLHHAGEVAAAFLAGLREAHHLDEEEVKARWAEAVGPFLANHSCPVGLRHGTLVVRVVQPSVRYALEQGMAAELLARLQSWFGRDRIRALTFTTV